MANPADHSNPLIPLTTNAVVNVFGPWIFQVQTTTDTQILSFVFNGPTGNPSFPNEIELDIGIGEPGVEVPVIEKLSWRDTDAGSGFQSQAKGHYLIPWKFTSGTKISARVKGIEGPGGVVNVQFQILALES